MKNRTKKIIAGSIIMASLITGCATDADKTKATQAETFYEGMITMEYSERDKDATYDEETAVKIVLNKTSATIEGSGAVYKEGKIIISQEGTYIVSGNLDDGQILVETEKDEKVQLVLNNANITNKSGSAIYVKEADKVFLTLAETSKNSVSDAAEYSEEEVEEDINATIFSKADLTINGKGALSVNANYKHGISSKDDLIITGGAYTINSKADAIKGKDCVAILDGSFNITAGSDGIEAYLENEETEATTEVATETTKETSTEVATETTKEASTEAATGYVVIDGGSFNIKSAKDAIIAEGILQITDGEFNIVTGGGSANATAKINDDFQRPVMTDENGNVIEPPMWDNQDNKRPVMKDEDGNIIEPQLPRENDGRQRPVIKDENGNVITPQRQKDSQANDTTLAAEEADTESVKALKATGRIYITGGVFSIDSLDDAIHSNISVSLSEGAFDIQSGDDGIHADESIAIDGGKINIAKSYEGIEASKIVINEGEINIKASDDGINAAGGNDSIATNSRNMQDQFKAVEGVEITINSGTISIDANGDGIDSNGELAINGGEIIVSGPLSNANAAIDYNGEGIIKAGTVIAGGSSSMAESFSETSTQASIMVNFGTTIKAGTIIALTDEKDNTIICYSSEKDIQNIVISSADVKLGSSYKLYLGGSNTGIAVNGIFEEGTYTKGELKTTIKVASLVTKISEDGSEYTRSMKK